MLQVGEVIVDVRVGEERKNSSGVERVSSNTISGGEIWRPSLGEVFRPRRTQESCAFQLGSAHEGHLEGVICSFYHAIWQ